jgi:hypothetical protein
MILGGIQETNEEWWRIRDDQSPSNNANLNSELLLSGDEVFYIQPINNLGEIILDCVDTNSVYRQILALSQLRIPTLLDTGLMLINVVFDYSQKPCVKWADYRKLANPPLDFIDEFTVYLRAI